MYLITECDKFGNLKNFAIGLEFFPRIFFLKISDHNNMIKVMYFLKIYLSKIWGNSQEREEKKVDEIIKNDHNYSVWKVRVCTNGNEGIN